MNTVLSLRRSIGLPTLNIFYVIVLCLLALNFIGAVGFAVVAMVTEGFGVGVLILIAGAVYTFLSWLFWRLAFEVVAAIFRIARASELTALSTGARLDQ